MKARSVGKVTRLPFPHLCVPEMIMTIVVARKEGWPPLGWVTLKMVMIIMIIVAREGAWVGWRVTKAAISRCVNPHPDCLPSK